MKDGYRYQDGKVLVTNYNNNNYRDVQARHYQDNIEEILITENVLEELQKLYNDVVDIVDEDEDEITSLKSEISLNGFLVFLVTFIVGGPLSLLLALAGIKHIITLIVFFIASGVLTYKFSILSMIERIKELEKQLKGDYLSLENIENEIKKNQNKLKELQDDMSRSKLDNPSDNIDSLKRGEYIQLDYVGKLKELREYLGLCYAIGYRQDEFLKRYDTKDLEEFMKVDSKLRDTVEKEEYKVLKREFTDRIRNR